MNRLTLLTCVFVTVTRALIVTPHSRSLSQVNEIFFGEEEVSFSSSKGPVVVTPSEGAAKPINGPTKYFHGYWIKPETGFWDVTNAAKINEILSSAIKGKYGPKGSKNELDVAFEVLKVLNGGKGNPFTASINFEDLSQPAGEFRKSSIGYSFHDKKGESLTI